jgi:carboxyl-terminal processing protease
MKNRSITAAAVLSCALVLGGWLMERGPLRPVRDLSSHVRLFDDVMLHIRRDYVDALPDSTLYRLAIDGALRELHDAHTVFLDARRLTQLDEATAGQYAGVGIQRATIVRDGVGYVKLTIFSSAAAADLTHAIDSLRGAGARSLVLDLRGDPGGLLSQGVAVADLFLDTNQVIVATRGRTAGETHTYADRFPQRWVGMPIVVLTDSATASASEIVAGALQDHDRALIVGTATYGKGSAQRVFRLDDVGLKMTTALWYTPSGRSINRALVPDSGEIGDKAPSGDHTRPRPRFKTDAGRIVLGGGGIVPDVEVANRVATAADRAFQRALGAKLPRFRDAIMEYVLLMKASNVIRDPNFTVTAAMRDELYRRMQARGVVVTRAVYDSAGPIITRALSSQLSHYLFGPQVEFARGLREDRTMTRAVELLRGARTPAELLGRVPSRT